MVCRRIASGDAHPSKAQREEQEDEEEAAPAYLSVKASTGECGAVAMNADTASRCLMGSAGTRTTKFPSSFRSASWGCAGAWYSRTLPILRMGVLNPLLSPPPAPVR